MQDAMKTKQADWPDTLRAAIDERTKTVSLYALAKECKISQTALRKFQIGERPDLRLSSAQRIARVLGLVLR